MDNCQELMQSLLILHQLTPNFLLARVERVNSLRKIPVEGEIDKSSSEVAILLVIVEFSSAFPLRQ